MPFPYQALAVATGAIYLFGGDDDGPPTFQDTDQYDPDTWTSKTNMPTPGRSKPAAANNGGGGTSTTAAFLMGGDGGNLAGYLTDNDRYQKTDDTWTSRTSIPSAGGARSGSVAIPGILAAGGAAVYLMGGFDGSEFDRTEEYAITDTYTNKTDLPSPARQSFAGAQIDSTNKLYIYGGGSPDQRDTEEFTISTNAWASKTDMPAPDRFQHAGSGLNNSGTGTANSAGYSVGNAGATDQDNDEYDPDTWTSRADMLSPGKSQMAASSLGTAMYIMGGEALPTTYQTTDRYRLDVWTNMTNSPSTTQRAASAPIHL